MNDQTNPSPMDEPEEPELPPLADQNLEPSTPTSQPLEKQPQPPMFKISWQFAAGFLGWFLVNGLLWLLVSSASYGFIQNLFVFPINILVLILLSVEQKTRQIGGGILVAIGINLIISVVLGFVFNGVCLIPFFFNNY